MRSAFVTTVDVDAAAQHAEPKQESCVEIESLGADVEFVTDAEHYHNYSRCQQVPEVQMLGISDSNDEDASKE